MPSLVAYRWTSAFRIWLLRRYPAEFKASRSSNAFNWFAPDLSYNLKTAWNRTLKLNTIGTYNDTCLSQFVWSTYPSQPSLDFFRKWGQKKIQIIKLYVKVSTFQFRMSVQSVLNSSNPSLPERSTSNIATMLRHTSFEKPSLLLSENKPKIYNKWHISTSIFHTVLVGVKLTHKKATLDNYKAGKNQLYSKNSCYLAAGSLSS